MKNNSGETNKKTWLAAAVGLAAIAAVSGSFMLTRPSEAADREAVKKQRTAAGMPDMEAMRDKMREQQAKDLGLNGRQKQQMKEADDKMGPQMGKIFGDKSLSQEQKMQKMQQAGAAHEAEVKTILTAEQQAKYEQMRQAFRGGFGGPGGGRPPGGGNSGRPMMPPGGFGGPPPGGFGGPPPGGRP